MTLAHYSTDRYPTERCINSKPGVGGLPIICMTFSHLRAGFKGIKHQTPALSMHNSASGNLLSKQVLLLLH